MTTSFMSQSPAWMAAIVNGAFSHTMELTHCTAESPSHSKQPMPTALIQVMPSLRPTTNATTKESTRLPANTASILHADGVCACNSAKTGLTFANSLPNTTYHTALPANATIAATTTARKFIRETFIGFYSLIGLETPLTYRQRRRSRVRDIGHSPRRCRPCRTCSCGAPSRQANGMDLLRLAPPA